MNGRPHIGEIIKDLREQRGLSQEALAGAMFINRSLLSQIENGKLECSDDMLHSLKAALDISNLPLCDLERDEFIDDLHKWYDIISERKLDEAKELRVRLSVIKLLPHDKESNILFSLFECRLLLIMDERAKSKEILDALDVDALSHVQLYHYYFNQGTYNIKNKCHQEALDLYLKAYDLVKYERGKSAVLYYNIALAYRELGFINQSITFLEKACVLHTQNRSSLSEFYLYNFLGISYANIGLLQRSEILLDKAYEIAVYEHKSNIHSTTKTNLGIVHLNYGFLYRMAKKWSRAIRYFDSALTYLEIEDINYLETLYQKMRTLIEMGNLSACIRLFDEGIELSKNHEAYSLAFETLKIIVNPDDKSAIHLETNILPYFLENREVHWALDFAKFLSDYYKAKEKGHVRRSLNMSHTARLILEQMLEGGVIR